MFLALPGTMAVLHPASASAQGLGTMQVTATVSAAPAAWPTLAAATELAAGADAPDKRTRLDLGLARLELEAGAPEDRRVRIRVDYLRN